MDMLADSVSTPRGMAVKVLDLGGFEVLNEHCRRHNPGLCLRQRQSLWQPDAAGFLEQIKLLEANVNDPEIFKKLVSATARVLNAVLGVFGGGSGRSSSWATLKRISWERPSRA